MVANQCVIRNLHKYGWDYLRHECGRERLPVAEREEPGRDRVLELVPGGPAVPLKGPPGDRPVHHPLVNVAIDLDEAYREFREITMR